MCAGVSEGEVESVCRGECEGEVMSVCRGECEVVNVRVRW